MPFASPNNRNRHIPTKPDCQNRPKGKRSEHPMNNPELTIAYNYEEFTPEKVSPLFNFDNRPALGTPAPDFPLWYLGRTTTNYMKSGGKID